MTTLDDAVEMGMEAAPALEDHHSSMMPWSHPPSLAPGSSIRGSAQKRQIGAPPSPLVGRGSMAQSIQHYSDPAVPDFGSDDFAGFASQGSLMDLDGGLQLDLGQLELQASGRGLNSDGQEFLAYLIAQAVEKGTKDHDEQHRTIDFEQLATPGVHSRVVAAQAFLIVLGLASKDIVKVEQQGVKNMRPFGKISLNVPVTAED